jgi:exportin-2 (importin alpha re-exporter)
MEIFPTYHKTMPQVEGEPNSLISSQDRELIKSGIVDLMISSVSNIQLQLSEAVSIIADNDFPHNWQSLMKVQIFKCKPVFESLE